MYQGGKVLPQSENVSFFSMFKTVQQVLPLKFDFADLFRLGTTSIRKIPRRCAQVIWKPGGKFDKLVKLLVTETGVQPSVYKLATSIEDFMILEIQFFI